MATYLLFNMNYPEVTVVDYGMGNLRSVVNALRYIGCETVVSADPDCVVRAECLLLPGVGSFNKAMLEIQKRNLDQAIAEAVSIKGRNILGICLGMQLMALDSSEDGKTQGLSLIDANVDRFSTLEIGSRKLPHIGFNSVNSEYPVKLLRGLDRSADFYFVHSYRILPNGLNGTLATCNYGKDFVAIYERNNIFATQFHPEKSQANGLNLIKNFVSQ